MASSSVSDQSQPFAYLHDVDVGVYNAAVEGEVTDILEEKGNELVNLLTPNGNTVLHIHITTSPACKVAFVRHILALCPALLQQPNRKGETPLHLAARYGRENVANLLITRTKSSLKGDLEAGGGEAVKQMLRAKNGVGDTALHEAVRFRHLLIVRLLTKEDPEFSYPPNRVGETPLYIASERKYSEMVCEILDNCTSPASAGPGRRTALHAATIAKDEVSTKKILEKMPHLTRATDDNLWTPMHYAVDHNNISMVKILLESGVEAVYIGDRRGRTSLHVAAFRGHHKILSEILTRRPGCSELVDDRGCNILHLAVEGDDRKTVALILDEPRLRRLCNEKNKDGNTPLHHAALLLRRTSMSELMNDKHRCRVDKDAFNDESKNVRDIINTDTSVSAEKVSISNWFMFDRRVKSGWRILESKDQNADRESDDFDRRKKEDEDELLTVIEKSREARLVAAALIATVTFTAGFTLPGGYVSEKGPSQGAAVLRHNTAFQAFMVLDSIAMVLSSLAVLLYLKLVISRLNKQRLINNFNMALFLTQGAIAAMILTFVTGTYAVLGHSPLLACTTCVLGLSFFLIAYLTAWPRDFFNNRVKRGYKLAYFRIKQANRQHNLTTPGAGRRETQDSPVPDMLFHVLRKALEPTGGPSRFS